MIRSTKVTAYLNSGKDPLIFNTIPDMLPYAAQITNLVVEDRSVALGILPGDLPNSNCIFEFLPERFPVLMELKLDGIGLKCTSLGRLDTLELRNFPEQSATMTFNSLLDLLGGSQLEKLTLDNYLSVAFNDQPTRKPTTMSKLKELYVRDTPQQTSRLLHELHLPTKTTICGLYGNTVIGWTSNVFLRMLPSSNRRPDLYLSMFTKGMEANLELSEDTVRLDCHEPKVQLTLEVNSTLRQHPKADPAVYEAWYSAVVAAAGGILGLVPALVTLKCTGTSIRVHHRAWGYVFNGVKGLQNLTIVDEGHGHITRGLLEVIASPPRSDQEVLKAPRALCLYLKKLHVVLRVPNQDAVLEDILEAVLKAVKNCASSGGRLKELVLEVQAQYIENGRDRYGQPTYKKKIGESKGWEDKLLAHVNSVQIKVL
ncbi:hypothetical protein K466DRAFT_659424 [Polyporus arcularius HHB13444]|uniref:Uncharacterized protein n=1 Tax=Polyporus arcularius HHB13444 TaxID=1314778 RepID=A0A5C3PQY1_9APHY|nr:hypothetical protein K466DRAFT_659424 [Polyporus arcularius HHB13444]